MRLRILFFLLWIGIVFGGIFVLGLGVGMEVLLKIVFVYSGESGIFGFI